MKSDKIELLAFDLYGDYAHFRKAYTTASQLTYGVPPRTTLSGITAGMLGWERDSYYQFFSEKKSRFAVSLLSPIRKTKINLNLVKTKDETLGFVDLRRRAPSRAERIQVPFDMVKDPKYRIHLWLREKNAFERLESLLRSHKCVYTPYLGISELLADFEFKGKHEAFKRHGEADISSVLKKDHAKIYVERGKRYVRERVPGFFDKDRTPIGYIDLIYEPDGKPIHVQEATYWRIGDKNIALF